MMKNIFLSILCCVALFTSCGGNTKQDVMKTNETAVSQIELRDKPRTIHVFSVIFLSTWENR